MIRAFQSLARKEWIRVALLLAAWVAVFFWNVTFGPSTFLTSTFTFLPNTMPDGAYGYAGHRVVNQPTRDMGASAFQTEPLGRLAERMVKQGHLPLWNPYAGTGVPLAANMQSGVFFPLTALAFLLPDSAWPQVSDVATLLGFFFAGWFTFLFVRSIGLARPGALGAAIAYMFCGNLLYFVGAAEWRVGITLPLLLFAVEGLHSRRSNFSILLVALAVFLSITAGMPEATLFAMLLGGIYFLYRELADWTETRRAKPLIVGLAVFAAAVGLGAALAAFLILPFAEYLRLSWNSHPAGVGLESVPIDGAISILVPNFFGGVFPTWHNPYPPQLWGTIPYVGAVIAALALMSFARAGRFKSQSLFWAGVAGVFLLKAFGSPVVQWMGNLPLLDVSVFPRFAASVLMFSAAVLAGIGIDNVYSGRTSLRVALAAWAVVWLIMAGFTAYYWSAAVAAGKTEFIGLQVGIEALLVLLVAGVVLLADRRVAGPAAAAGLLVALVGIDLFIASPKDRSDKYDPFTTPPFASFLSQDKEPFRVLGLDSVLYPDSAGVYGLADIKDLDALYPSRMVKFLQTFVDPSVYDRFTGQDVLQNKFLDLLNVQYLISKFSLLDRWTSTDLTAQIAKRCANSPICSGYTLGVQDAAPVLQVGGTQAVWSSRIDWPIQLPASRLFLRFDLGAEGNLEPVLTEGWPRITYAVTVVDARGEHAVFSTEYRVNRDAASPWNGEAVDLSAFSGQAVTLSFTASCSTACGSGVVGKWKNVELIQPAADYAGSVGQTASIFLPVERDLHAAQNALVWVYDDEVKIYKSDSAFPRAFVVHNPVWANDADNALQQMSAASFDPRTQLVLEAIGPQEGTPQRGPTNDLAAARIVRQEPGLYEIQVTLDQPGFLVLSETSYPGWKAIVDGQEAKDYTADYVLQAVALGKGSHQVEFVYDPWTYRVGALISLIALGIGVLVSVYAWLRRSKSHGIPH